VYHLTQVNIGRLLAPLDDPQIAGFVSELGPINALADDSPGFIWRLQTADGDATAMRPYDDDRIIFNMSVWASLADLTAFSYGSRHRQVMQQRRRWFERPDGLFMVLWWIPAGHIPSVAEGKERLELLQAHGETPDAFSFKRPFASPDAMAAALEGTLASCS